jgi:hypothetical protein
MTATAQMLEAYPRELGRVDPRALEAAITACFECSQVCTACADACLSERMVSDLTKCIRTNLDCADICDTTGRVLSRHTGYDAHLTRAVLQACMQACQSCGDVCTEHAAMHQHCQVCAESCRSCEQACRDLVGKLG